MTGYVNYFIQTLVAVAVPLFFVVNGFLLFGRGFNLKKHIRNNSGCSHCYHMGRNYDHIFNVYSGRILECKRIFAYVLADKAELDKSLVVFGRTCVYLPVISGIILHSS